MPKKSSPSRDAKNAEGIVTIPLRMPAEMKADIERVTIKSRHLTEQAVMKLALEKGLGVVEAMFTKPAKQAA